MARAGWYQPSGPLLLGRPARQLLLSKRGLRLSNRAFAELLRDPSFAGLRLKSDVLANEEHLSGAPRGLTKRLLHTHAAAPRGD